MKDTKDRFEPKFDLIERVLQHFLLNAMTDQVLGTHVLFSRDDTFEDAFSLPDEFSGTFYGMAEAPIEIAEAQLNNVDLSNSLVNCLIANALPRDPDRVRRLEEAIHTGKLRDNAGLLGKIEVLWDIQLEQVLSGVNPLTVAFVDMNGLKAINDNLGHEEGDRSIAEFQNKLLEYAENGLSYRDGGDEFILLFRLDSEAAVSRIRSLLQDVANNTNLSASAGIAFSDNPSEGPEFLKKRADEAMYKAKEGSKIEESVCKKRPSALSVEGGQVEFFCRGGSTEA